MIQLGSLGFIDRVQVSEWLIDKEVKWPLQELMPRYS